MYFMITSHCNMSCAHCCFSCYEDNPNAKHMDIQTFTAGLKFMKDLAIMTQTFEAETELDEEIQQSLYDMQNDCLALGGGEPTMHPKFWEFLGVAIEFAEANSVRVWMRTNGKLKRRALAVLALGAGDNELFSCELSADQYHEDLPHANELNHYIPSRYTDIPHDKICDVGHARENGISGGGEGSHSLHKSDAEEAGLHAANCVCDSMRIAPDGSIFLCGCDGVEYKGDWYDAPTLGNVKSVSDCRRLINWLSYNGYACLRSHDKIQELLLWNDEKGRKNLR